MAAVTHELAYVTHPLGQQGTAREALRAERARRPDALLGAWGAETGILNRIVALWSVEGASMGAGTAGDDDWLSGSEVRRRMTARRRIANEALSAPLLELRHYAPHRGQCEAFVAALLDALPHREKYSPCAAVWTTQERGCDVVVHLWSYRTFDERLSARDAAMRDEGWAAYRQAIRPMLQAMHSTLLVPVTP